MGYTMVLNM